MPALLIRQRVSDYGACKRAFADLAHARTANGCQEVHVFRNPDDSNEMVILLTWDSLVRARLYSKSDELLESLDQPGVTDRPELFLLEEIDDGTIA
jgi:hypothetical protein